MYLCICKSVSDQQIRHAVEQGARAVSDLSVQFGIGSDCGRCLDSVREWLDLYLAALPSLPITPTPLPTPVGTTSPPVSAPPPPARASWFTVEP